MSEILTVSQAARRLGVSPLSARRLIAAGVLPARRYVECGHLGIDAADVKSLLDSSQDRKRPRKSGIARRSASIRP